MCLTAGNESKRRYEDISRPSRPVAPVYKADRYENPRRAPVVPPNPRARKMSEKQVKEALRDAEKIASNRRDKLFATIAPLIIKKDTPPPPQKHQRAVKPAELGNTVSIRRTHNPPAVDERNIHPALRSSGKVFGQDDIQPASRTAFKPRDLRRPQPGPQTSTRQVEQSRVHSSLKTTEALELRTSLHPAFRNLPDDEAHPRHHVSGSRKHAVEREVHTYLGKPHNYADSPREAEVSPLNVTHKLPYAASHRRR
ncbi:hypothetical protein KVR01_005480 [Diaporthe batatas]|uniref:uncharacterized protein n=1 Tax=Diaporthe batatas TaxID=748121 RepID=UPI001D03F25F|nr:uncharacterized protein KVR01_005480 [Diaporthe batatas]KAG8165205.1 hypothetical protein KVR01_005480 [Diaporthe batatas]